MWPWILVPFQHEWPFFFLGGLMIQGIPDTCRPLWAVCGTTRAKGSLEKGWNLNSYFTSIFSLIAELSLSTELPSNFLELFPHRKESGFDRRKWFFTILFPCLWPSSCRSSPSNICSSCSYTLWEISSLCLSSEFLPQLIFSEVAIHFHT